MNIPRWLGNTLKGCGCLSFLFIIFAILFPVFIKSRIRDHAPDCASNEKILGLGLLQYAQDNDGFMPNIAEAPGSKNTWRNAIFPYIKSNSVFQCPDRHDKALGPDGLPRSYAANYSGHYTNASVDKGEGAFAGPGSKPISYDQLKNPAGLLAVCEVEGSNAPEFNIDDAARFGPDTHTLWAGHSKRSNFLFADGHVKSLPPTVTASYMATDGSRFHGNSWYRDSAKPLSPTGVAILAEAEKRG